MKIGRKKGRGARMNTLPSPGNAILKRLCCEVNLLTSNEQMGARSGEEDEKKEDLRKGNSNHCSGAGRT